MSAQLIKKYEEIEAIKDRFLLKVANVSDEQFNKIPAEGKWSLGQTFYHMYFAEVGTIKMIQKNLRENKVLKKTAYSDVFRNILLVITLRLPIKFKAPAVVSKVVETITFDEVRTLFENNTNDFKLLLNELPADLENKQIFKHPIAGMFNINQVLNFVREHYLHHEMQLNALLK